MRERPPAHAHLSALSGALRALEKDCGRLEDWGTRLAEVLLGGGRLLAAGNGGSAAQAQHLTSELVGRYVDERLPLSAISLNAEPSALTAIYNDYGTDECFARQVRGHGRRGDVLMTLSTSGESGNVIAAAAAAAEIGMEAWALTGPAPNSLAAASAEAVCITADATSTVQEAHLVALHLLCGAVDRQVARATGLPQLAEALR